MDSGLGPPTPARPGRGLGPRTRTRTRTRTPAFPWSRTPTPDRGWDPDSGPRLSSGLEFGPVPGPGPRRLPDAGRARASVSVGPPRAAPAPDSVWTPDARRPRRSPGPGPRGPGRLWVRPQPRRHAHPGPQTCCPPRPALAPASARGPRPRHCRRESGRRLEEAPRGLSPPELVRTPPPACPPPALTGRGRPTPAQARTPQPDAPGPRADRRKPLWPRGCPVVWRAGCLQPHLLTEAPGEGCGWRHLSAGPLRTPASQPASGGTERRFPVPCFSFSALYFCREYCRWESKADPRGQNPGCPVTDPSPAVGSLPLFFPFLHITTFPESGGVLGATRCQV